MGRNVWIQLDNLHSSVRVSRVWHLDSSRETCRCDPFPCRERDHTACSSEDSTAAVCVAPLFLTGYHKYQVKACSLSQSLNTWSFAAMGVLVVSPSPCFLSFPQYLKNRSSTQDSHITPCSTVQINSKPLGVMPVCKLLTASVKNKHPRTMLFRFGSMRKDA